MRHERRTACRRAAGLVLALILAVWIWLGAAQASDPMVKSIAQIGFTVADLDRSVAFYSRVLTFKKVAEFEVTGTAYDHLVGVFGTRMRVAHMQLGEQLLELTQYVFPPPLSFSDPAVLRASHRQTPESPS